MKTDQSAETELAIALGSNLGDRIAHLRAALTQLEHAVGKVLGKSKLYYSHPVGNVEGEFLNAVVLLKTRTPMDSWMPTLLAVESAMGRVRGGQSGNRTIDLDLILGRRDGSCLVLTQQNLLVPHPRAHEREFVMRPLSDVVPEWEWPTFNKTVKQLAAQCRQDQVIRVVDHW